MGHAGKSYVRNQPEMNKGVANLRLGGIHLNRICISLRFRSKNKKADRNWCDQESEMGKGSEDLACM